VGIAAEIAKHLLGTAERGLRVNHPVLTEERAEESSESPGTCQRYEISVEAELALGEGTLESGDELTPEDSPQHLNGEKEAIAGADPASVIGREAARRNHAMDMGMMLQFLVPGVEHAEETRLGTEMLRRTSHFEQRRRRGAEQEIVKDLLVLQGQRGEPMREGEDDVDVRRGQEFPAPRFQPTLAGPGLALGAVPIPTGVVRDGAISAAGTRIDMPAE
jgi:hypothetical protein